MGSDGFGIDKAFSRWGAGKGYIMGDKIVASRGLLAKVVAGMAIALFWCVSAISTVGVASLATAVSAVISPASAESEGFKWYEF